MQVDAPIDKPMNQWCVHCIPGTGCGIHATRPPVCRNFHCVWLMDAGFGEEWRPELCHMVLWLDLEGRRLNVNVDEDFPHAWLGRAPIVHSSRRWRPRRCRGQGQVVVYVGSDVFVILPDRHAALGPLAPDEYIFIEHLPDGRWDARKVDEIEAETLRAAGQV